MLIELRQSNTDRFWRVQSVHTFPTISSTYKVGTLKLFANLIGTQQFHLLVFAAEAFSPLTYSKPTETICCLLL